MDPKPERPTGRAGDAPVPVPDYPVHPVIEPGHTFTTINDKISAIVLTRRQPIAWFITLGIGFLLVQALAVSVGYLLFKGIGIWATTCRSAGPSTSSTSCGGSASATPAR
jgi:molybdopterin-containing oxidoreductase family membrane subunit